MYSCTNISPLAPPAQISCTDEPTFNYQQRQHCLNNNNNNNNAHFESNQNYYINNNNNSIETRCSSLSCNSSSSTSTPSLSMSSSSNTSASSPSSFSSSSASYSFAPKFDSLRHTNSNNKLTKTSRTKSGGFNSRPSLIKQEVSLLASSIQIQTISSSALSPPPPPLFVNNNNTADPTMSNRSKKFKASQSLKRQKLVLRDLDSDSFFYNQGQDEEEEEDEEDDEEAEESTRCIKVKLPLLIKKTIKSEELNHEERVFLGNQSASSCYSSSCSFSSELALPTANALESKYKARKQRKFRDLFEPLIDLTQPNVTTIMQRPVDMGETKRYKRKNFDDLEKRRTYTCKYDGMRFEFIFLNDKI